MAKRPTLVLFGYALYLVICGLSPLLVLGLDTAQQIHGIQLAAVIGLCGLFASRFKQSPALAILAIDSAGIILLGTSINYARLANNWYGASGMAWYSPYLVGAMAIGGFIAFWLLMITRPKCRAKCSEWWRPTPLITIPSLLILPSTRRRHGLGIPRRIGLALGMLFLIVGTVFSMSSRFPQVSIAQLVKLGQLAQKNDALLKFALAEPDLVMKFIEDPSNARNILDDPRAQELIEELSEEGGLLHGVDTQAVVDSIASGNFENLNEILEDSDLSSVEELLALAVEEDSAIGELIGVDGATAAKNITAKLALGNTTLEEALTEDDGEAARKLISSVTRSKSDDTKNPDMDELMRKLSESIDPEMLKRLQGAGGIDINDSKVQDAFRKMNIDQQDVAKFAALASSSEGAATKLISESGSNSPGSERINSKVSSNKLGTRVAASRVNSKISAEPDNSEISNKQPHIFFTPVEGKSKPKPLEPIFVQDIVKPQQDIITKRLDENEHSSVIEIDANEVSVELASKDAIDESQESGIKGIYDAIETIDAIHSASGSMIDIDENLSSTKVANTDVIGKSPGIANGAPDSRQTATAAIDIIVQQLAVPIDNHKSIAGLLCIIVGLVAVSASLSRR